MLLRRFLLPAALLLFCALPASAQLLHDVVDREVTLVSVPGSTPRYRADADAPFTGIAVEGESDGPVDVAVRFTDAAGWTDWLPLYTVHSATGNGFVAAYRGEIVRTGPFEVRLSTSQARLTDAGTFDARRDVQAEAPSGLPFFSGKGGPAAVPAPFLRTRADWNAAPFRGRPEPLAPQGFTRMTFHHAAGFGAYTEAEALAQVKAIQDFHQNGRGWSDIGYQFVMDQTGRVYQGRPFLDGATALAAVPRLALGAHVGGANTGNIGVCVLGCYHPPEGGACTDVLSPAARDSLVALFAFLSEAYGPPPTTLLGHRDQSSTSCPGDNNYALLPALRLEIAEARARGTTPLPEGYTLGAATPQPARGAVTARYFLPADGLVHVTLYDALGREVARPIGGLYERGGQWHTARIDASGLAAGVYFYRLRVEGFRGTDHVSTRTLVVVR